MKAAVAKLNAIYHQTVVAMLNEEQHGKFWTPIFSVSYSILEDRLVFLVLFYL